MRFIGLLGIASILAIGFLVSRNRRQIRPRIILWGVGLQLLFAVIILAENVLSWAAMFVFAFLILLYILEDKFLGCNHWKEAIFPGAMVFSGSVLAVGVFYLLDKVRLAGPLLLLLILVFFVLYVIKRKEFTKYLTAGAITIGLGMLIQRGVYGRQIFAAFADQVDKFLKLTDLGSTFLFGNLVKPEYTETFGFQFAFAVLPTIIFFSAFMSILYYLGIMQVLVKIMARFMRWTMGTSGAETLSCSANIFVGQTEAPLLIRPFLDEMTVSELHAIMVGGFATIAGGVLAGYIRLGVDPGHLIAASVMSAPAALVMAKLFMPETEHSVTAGDVEIPDVGRADNLLDAAARGVTDGLKLAVNVGAMLLAFIALIGVVDTIFGFFDKLIDGKLLAGALSEVTGEYKGFFPGSLKTLFGTIFSPLAFLMGVPWKEAMEVGNLLGIKIAVNEFVAYGELSKHIAAQNLSPRALTIATYALCGFANFASIGIQIGGIGALAPGRRSDLAKVALRAMFAGALASWMTASIAGVLIK